MSGDFRHRAIEIRLILPLEAEFVRRRMDCFHRVEQGSEKMAGAVKPCLRFLSVFSPVGFGS